METQVINLTLTIKRQADGSYVVRGKELPILLVAKDLERLKRKLRELRESLDAYFDGISAGELEHLLRERGIHVEVVGLGEVDGDISMPVLVGA